MPSVVADGGGPARHAWVLVLAARLPADELAHPLDVGTGPRVAPAEEPAPAGAAWMDRGAGTSPVQEGEPWPS
ncbi:hypothetical protein [Blastococcus sp. TF02A-26]|uniref:hypothetical protein n=1 Tax=Blastococcus sp. TF02A-26 TaxID=2250577 RepID=UPI0011BE60F6|nr:hypothetical protein [Blastococcus sp. TF02A-26]